MRNFRPFFLLPAVLGTALWAHGGVTNPAVMERMNNMSLIGDNMKTLSQMAKGQMAFDAVAAEAAVSHIKTASESTIGLFTAQENDPKSEALPAIWTDFEGFTAKADALTQAAQGVMGTIQSSDDLGPALRAMGTTCKSCHDSYRK